MVDQLDDKFASFLQSLKQSGLDDVAASRAFHHSAVDPREWKKIADALAKQPGDRDGSSGKAN
ncbi:hypothetical protein [Thalassobaculum litoreum]|uniref:Uncharacterized protein n=1 Tax=Thalassobaculum litoreum DSM 18839 TaxID=1123362 RepID=A0A8G2BMR4_9PROT|nr:hypothetical protein [Thalassobaculum litoreum]SDG58971.1 hypothetical protein SAMN05660686_04950 [Thalassobaculum litoreum DSM 18839]